MSVKQVKQAIKYYLYMLKSKRLKDAFRYVDFYSLLPRLMGFKDVSTKYRISIIYEYAKYLYYGHDKNEDYIIQCVPRSLFPYYLSHKTQHYEKGYNAIDKWRFYQLMQSNDLNIPVTYAVKDKGKFLSLDNDNIEINNLPDKKYYFVKPSSSSAGASARKITKDQIGKLLDGMIVQDMMQNHGSIRQISGDSSSLNTIRVHTFYSTLTDEVHILNAHLKIGVPGSEVDTFGAGLNSVAVMINVSDGKLHQYGYNGKTRQKVFNAYETGPMFKDCSISEWNEIKDYVIKASRIIGTQFVGWDIGIVETGVLAVEANSGSDYAVAQAFFEPFLFTPYITDFLANADFHKWIHKWKNETYQKFPDIMKKLYESKNKSKAAD